MIESEVKVYDSKINLHPIDTQNIDTIINSPFDAVEITSTFEEVTDRDLTGFVTQRRIRRHRSAGIF
jgi:hypothetical protein